MCYVDGMVPWKTTFPYRAGRELHFHVSELESVLESGASANRVSRQIAMAV